MSALHVANIGGEIDAAIRLSRTVTDGATTAASTTVTSATAAFTAQDVGAAISGGSIPAGTTITSVTSATDVVVSAAPTATATAVSLTIGDQVRMSSPALEALPAVAAPDILHICVDPDGIAGEPEWMQITAHTAAATTATVTRATEGSTARAHRAGVEWVHTLAPSEVDLHLLHVREEQASGTNGSSSTSGSWETRVLNTVVTNEIAGASLATNEVTLPAGTYEIDAWGAAYAARRNRLRLYDVTAAAVLFTGPSNFTNGTDGGNGPTLRGRFTLAVTSAVRLEHRVETSQALGYGVASSFGVNEVHADVMIRKVG